MTQRKESSTIVFARKAIIRKDSKTMSHYQHLNKEEREKLLLMYTEKKSLHYIAKQLKRSVSTISRELKRNSGYRGNYSAAKAQENYLKRRKNCRRHKLLEDAGLWETVRRLFLEQQWSPEQIAHRLALEQSQYQISYTTIYRGIYAGILDVEGCSYGKRGMKKHLRHRGKTRHKKGIVDKRGKVVISHRIDERPQEANERKVIGHWEADTVAGKLGSACLVTYTDRCSRYLVAGKIPRKQAKALEEKTIALYAAIPQSKIRSITPDRGREFTNHAAITSALGGVQFYFANPHTPWQRGTNENTNGLLREYFPKSFDMALFSDDEIAAFVDKLNKRPRKCLGWKSPFEVFFDTLLHLT